MANIDIKGFFKSWLPGKKVVNETIIPGTEGLEPNSYYTRTHYFVNPIITQPFDGEKTPGEMGAPLDYHLQYQWLRVRSWQSFLESEVTQSIINKFGIWVVSRGLKLQAEPEIDLLKAKGINLNLEDFSKTIESYYKIHGKAINLVDYKKLDTQGAIEFEAQKNAIVGGDVLVILRVNNTSVNIQLIDGAHLSTPLDGKALDDATAAGNYIIHGVEVNKKGQHIAYHVRTKDNGHVRVLRVGKNSGTLMAFLVYGSKYRIDDTRGMPLITAVMETLRKLDRYKEATVGSAEERQKIAFAIEHNANSTGENPLLSKMQQARQLGLGEAPESKSTSDPEASATKIAATTKKQAFNMPIGSSLKLLESKNELYFKDFYDTNIAGVCAAVGIPFEVARSMYDSNYSASRAAIKDWEHMLKFHRGVFTEQFNQPFYNLFLDVQVLNGTISAPGYLKALADKDEIILTAYRSSRFIGATVPNIDPLKEVAAERKKLGDDSTPLTTFEDAAERLGLGSWSQIIERVKSEMNKTKEFKPKTTE